MGVCCVYSKSKMESSSWTQMSEERLIESVRAFQCIWDVSSKVYKDLRARENAWMEVAQKVT